jgi:hypothetical protein
MPELRLGGEDEPIIGYHRNYRGAFPNNVGPFGDLCCVEDMVLDFRT